MPPILPHLRARCCVRYPTRFFGVCKHVVGLPVQQGCRQRVVRWLARNAASPEVDGKAQPIFSDFRCL